jgi:hypothetical protein
LGWSRVTSCRIPLVEVDEYVFTQLGRLVDAISGKLPVFGSKFDGEDLNIGVVTNHVCHDNLTVKRRPDIGLHAPSRHRNPACVSKGCSLDEVEAGDVLPLLLIHARRCEEHWEDLR